MDLSLPDELAEDLSPSAVTKLKDVVAAYAKDLVDEASRLEKFQRSGSAEPEITSTMVEDADGLIRRGYVRKGRSWPNIIAQLLATGAVIVATWSSGSLNEDWGPPVFVVSVIVAIGALAYSLARGER